MVTLVMLNVTQFTVGQALDIDVNQLSDEQIRTLAEKAKESGYSEDQLSQLAQSRGLSTSQIATLQSRIENLEQNSVSSQRTLVDSNKRLRQTSNVDPFDYLSVGAASADKLGTLPIFGTTFFNNPNLTFTPSVNVPTPATYQLGPGDEIIIDVWGASEKSYRLQVSPEGSLMIPGVGPVYVNGLMFEKADNKITQYLKRIYSSLGDNTFSQISLGQTRSISVNVIGEVTRPGTYLVSSFSTAFNALYLSGGPSLNGTLRAIEVFRDGRKIATLDTYNFLVFGEGQNIQLHDQDVILVKPYLSRVSIIGEVKRPAVYELKEGETLNQLLLYAGGFTSLAFRERVTFQRNLSNQKTVLTVNKKDFGSTLMQSGDRVNVNQIQNLFVNRVTINGAVKQPGDYELTEGMMLSELIYKTEGFTPDVFLNRATILRKNEDYTLTTIPFSPKSVISGEFDLKLNSEDVIKINTIFDMREGQNVTINGEVQSPGSFAYTENMTIKDLIFLADGFKVSAAKSFIEVARRFDGEQEVESKKLSQLFTFQVNEDLSLEEEDAAFVLQPYDLVMIRKSPSYQSQRIVEIEGEVLFPGKYVISNKGERISDLIEHAGGLTSEAYAEGATLIRESEYNGSQYDAAQKRTRIQNLADRDSLSNETTYKISSQESIAIELDKVLAKKGGPEINLRLMEGDILSIPKKMETIRVRGEVNSFSVLPFNTRMGLRDAVTQCGGFTKNAKRSKIFVVYANGAAMKTRNILGIKIYPDLKPGSEIIVPQKPPKKPVNGQRIISASSSLASLALVINYLVRSL